MGAISRRASSASLAGFRLGAARRAHGSEIFLERVGANYQLAKNFKVSELSESWSILSIEWGLKRMCGSISLFEGDGYVIPQCAIRKPKVRRRDRALPISISDFEEKIIDF